MSEQNGSDEIKADFAKSFWQNQPLEDTTMTLEEVRSRIARLARIVRRRNLIGGFACITVVLGFSYFAAVGPNTTFRVGAVLTVVGASFIAYHLVRGKLLPRGVPAPEMQSQAGLAFYRSELQRQRDFHQGWSLWSRLLIFAPGPIVFFIGQAKADPSQLRLVLLLATICVYLLGMSVPRNLRMARQFQRELDILNQQQG